MWPDRNSRRAPIPSDGCFWTCSCKSYPPDADTRCHNPETHDITLGASVDIDEVKEVISNLKGQDGITFSGGDPFMQANACAELAKYVKKLGYNVWCYTGYTFEELLHLSKTKKEIMDFLRLIDILV